MSAFTTPTSVTRAKSRPLDTICVPMRISVSPLVVGNIQGSGSNWATIVTQDLVADTTQFPMLEDHQHAGLALLQDGKVLVTGGDVSVTNVIFDPTVE